MYHLNFLDSPRNTSALVVRPLQACALLNIGLTRCYELINSGELESFKDGKARKITVSSIKAYVDRRLELSSSPDAKQVGTARPLSSME
jgi:excisionase family DNA binding protein